MQKKTSVIILAIYAAVMFLLSVIPWVAELIPEPYDKIVHFVASFLLVFILMQVFLSFGIRHRNLILFISTIVLVVLSEAIQIPIPDRTFSFYDMLADLAGACAYMIVSFIVGLNSKNRNITGSHKP